MTENPFSPKEATTYEMAVDREEDNRDGRQMEKEDTYHLEKKEQRSEADNYARWVKREQERIRLQEAHGHL